ncbi:MAG: ABC transporter ATP-binding protein [Kosmotogaceae bacterium]
MIKIEGLSKRFGSKPVLNNISVNIKEGEIFAFVGPNGAGKTTTLRCIYGELKPDSGSIDVFGGKLDSKAKQKIAVLTEDRLNFRRFTGEDYVRIWRMLYPTWQEKIFSSFAVHYKFDLSQRVEVYSMGMKTLFHMALTVASGADLLLLDEPTQNLDPVIRQEIMEVLRDYVIEEGKTMIISSHEIFDLEEIAHSFAIILEGHVLYTDTMDEAKEKHRMIGQGEGTKGGEVISALGNETLVKTTEEAGRFANFKEIVLGYLQGKRGFRPFEKGQPIRFNNDNSQD